MDPKDNQSFGIELIAGAVKLASLSVPFQWDLSAITTGMHMSFAVE